MSYKRMYRFNPHPPFIGFTWRGWEECLENPASVKKEYPDVYKFLMLDSTKELLDPLDIPGLIEAFSKTSYQKHVAECLLLALSLAGIGLIVDEDCLNTILANRTISAKGAAFWEEI